MIYLQKVLFVTIIILSFLPRLLQAAPPSQEETDFVYTVQAGDTLALIALRYNLKLTDLILANNLSNPNLIFPGQHLVLPGVTPPQTSFFDSEQTHVVQPGETVYEIAELYQVSAGAILLENGLLSPDSFSEGQTIHIPSAELPDPAPLEAPFAGVVLSEPMITQGRTLIVKVTLSEPASLSGTFEGLPLFFYDTGTEEKWAVAPIYALMETGTYPLIIKATRINGSTVTTFAKVTVIEGPYGTETIQLDANRGQLLAEETVQFEWETLKAIWSQMSPQPRWEGPFWYPVELETLRFTSEFGTRRNYNYSDKLSFHSGIDFGGGIGKPVYAAAPGTVVLAEPLAVRGKAILIDHGMGIFTGYWHQTEIFILEGQHVQRGDLIGHIGDTGLVTGPHLHWEVRIHGIAVDPIQWVEEGIP